MKILGQGKHLKVWKLLQMKARKIPRILRYNLNPFPRTSRKIVNTFSKKALKKHVLRPQNFRMFSQYIRVAYYSIGLFISNNFYRYLRGPKAISDQLVSEKHQKLPHFPNFFQDFIIDHSSNSIPAEIFHRQI